MRRRCRSPPPAVRQRDVDRQPLLPEHVDDGARAHHRLAARALAALEAVLLLGERRRERLLDEQVERAAVAGAEPHRAGDRAGDVDHAPQETAAQVFLRTGGIEEGRHVVERRQPPVLLRERAGLFLDPRLERAVALLELRGHLVEAQRELPELVGRLHRQARREVALSHALQPDLELMHGTDDEQERQVDERGRADDRERHQRELDAAQQAGGLGDVALECCDQPVDRGDELLDAPALAAACTALGRGEQHRLQHRPLGIQCRELGVDLRRPGDEQRPGRVTGAKRRDDPLEGRDVLADQRSGLWIGRPACLLREIGEPVGAHAQAAGVVDRRGAALEPPGNDQRQPDRDERHRKEGHLDADQLGGELLGRVHRWNAWLRPARDIAGIPLRRP